MLLSADRSALLVVDIQERLAPAIPARDRVVRNTRTLLRAAAELAVPVLATEHYPRGIGHTVPEVAELLPAGCVVEKIAFAAGEEPGFVERLDALGRDQIVIAGMEAHVCVMQTALSVHGRSGRSVFFVADAAASRDPANAELAALRLRDAGVGVVSTEMVVFEWLHHGNTPAFRALLELIR